MQRHAVTMRATACRHIYIVMRATACHYHACNCMPSPCVQRHAVTMRAAACRHVYNHACSCMFYTILKKCALITVQSSNALSPTAESVAKVVCVRAGAILALLLGPCTASNPQAHGKIRTRNHTYTPCTHVRKAVFAYALIKKDVLIKNVRFCIIIIIAEKVDSQAIYEITAIVFAIKYTHLVICTCKEYISKVFMHSMCEISKLSILVVAVNCCSGHVYCLPRPYRSPLSEW